MTQHESNQYQSLSACLNCLDLCCPSEVMMDDDDDDGDEDDEKT